MTLINLPTTPLKRWTEFKASKKYFAVIQLEGSGYAGDSGWTFDATSSATRLLKDVKHVTWSSAATIFPIDYNLPHNFVSFGTLPSGTVQVARIVGDGYHVPSFNDFDRSDWTGFNPANGIVNFITFYDRTYYIDQDASLAFAYSIEETVNYADWAGLAVFDMQRPATISLSMASKWQYLTMFMFTQKYFQLGDFTAYPGEGFSFPIKPKKIPSGFPSGGKYGIQYFDDATFRSVISLGDYPATSLTISANNIAYLKSSTAKTAAIWPTTDTYSVRSCRINSNSRGGILYSPGEDGSSSLVGWQNITGTPPKLTTLGTRSDTPFIWETWVP